MRLSMGRQTGFLGYIESLVLFSYVADLISTVIPELASQRPSEHHILYMELSDGTEARNCQWRLQQCLVFVINSCFRALPQQDQQHITLKPA